ncbi:Hypothetical_protein [Hexamita inflata]|uniref:Hypothetical_protein n=1 Tax=Hexamita inflata TaxID=28002 RepID=A0AA86PDH1_9EUKA|nr:Hypothetical protein HINF_LOCUS23411 [Hexamita inflata]
MHRKLNKAKSHYQSMLRNQKNAKSAKQMSKSAPRLETFGCLNKSLCDIIESSFEPLQTTIPGRLNDSSIVKTDSQFIFWDQSSVQNVKLLNITQNGGKKRIKEIIITVENVTEGQTEDDDAIFQLLFK